MNILVTGANGQLGNEMRIVAKDSADHYIFTDVTQQEGVETTFLDITDLDAIRTMVKENDVRAIVNCAAWTNVDAAEAPENRALVEKLNATAPENLARAMKEVGGWLVQISTDYVFGKEPYNTPCRPDQQGTPTGVYGETKKQGEERIQKVFNEKLKIKSEKLIASEAEGSMVNGQWSMAATSSSARPGSTANTARTSARRCSTSRRPSRSSRLSSTNAVLRRMPSTWHARYKSSSRSPCKASTTSRTKASARGTTSRR